MNFEVIDKPDRLIILCDLDGTLCDCQHRQHLAAQKDWDGFHALMPKDLPIEKTRKVVDALCEQDARLFYLTGRPEEMEGPTLKWLEDNLSDSFCSEPCQLIMRPRDDYRPDNVLKEELILENLKDEGSALCHEARRLMIDNETEYAEAYDSWEEFVDSELEVIQKYILILDDRDRVTESLRNAGYTVWQVAQGAF